MSLSNVQYDAVMRHYDEVRERKRYEQARRIEQVYKSIPEMMTLDDEVASRSLLAARRRIADPEADLSGYKAEMARITARKHSLLENHGFSADYPELQYDCPLCRDTGLINGRHCSCFDRTAAELLYGRYGLRKILETENFQHFSYNWYSDTIMDEMTGKSARETAVIAVQAARDMFSAGGIRGNLYIYGNTGVGKSFLTHCIAKEALDKGLSVLCFSSGDFFDSLAETTFEHAGRGRGPLRELVSSAELLIIDDLGTELTNSFTSSELFRVVNERIRDDRSTIISTNLKLKELSGKYSERVLSRITSEYTIIKLIGDDIRILKKLRR